MERITIVTINNPFDRRNREMKTVEFHGENLQFIRELYFPKDLETIVSLNGIIIRDESLEKIIPRNGDFIIFAPVLEGGGGDKDIGRALAMIALVVLAVMIPPSAIMGLPLSTMGGALAVMGIMTIGGLLINTLMPPVAPELNDVGYSDSTSQSYGWNPKTTQQQGLCIPKAYGLNKVHGNLISTYIDNTQPPKKYLNTLLCLGLGPISRIYDYKINNQSYETFTGVEVFSRPGLLTQTVIPNFDDTKTEYSTAPFPHKILSGVTYTYTTIGNAFDRLEIEVSYPQGILAYRDDATWYNFDGKVRVKMKGEGDPTYNTIQDSIQVTGSEPETWNGIWSEGRWGSDEANSSYWVEYSVGSADYRDHVDGENATLLWTETGDIQYVWRWMGDVTYNKVTVTTDEVTIHGDGKDPVIKTFIQDIPADKKGQYIISIENLDTSDSTDRVFRDCYLSAVREVVRDDFTYPRMALASLKSLATDQLSGSFDFSCLMEGALVANYISTTTYTGYTITYLNNPAWVCFDVLTQPVIDNQRKIVRWDGINPARLYIQDFIDWADWCDGLVTVTATGAQEKRITFNGIFDAQMNMWEAAWKVCQVGRASLIWRGTDLHVVVDKESDPVQLFTVGNIGIDSFKETFLSLEDRASEIEVDFNNLEKDYERDKLTVINSNIDNPANVVSLQLIGITKPTEAWRAANYRLLCNQHILRTIELDVDIDAIACTVGDVIRVQHDVPTWGYGGRVVAATTTTVVLDKEVSYTAATGEITIRLSDDTIVTRALDGAGSSTYTITVTSDFTTVPSKYDVYALGETTFYVKEYRIIDLSRTNDLQCHIIAVQYDEDVYNEDDSGATIPDEPYNAFNPYVSITAITLREDAYVDTSDTLVRSINVGYTIQDNAVFNHADIYYKEEGTLNWIFAGLTRTNRFIIPGVNPLTTYTVKPVGTNNLGLVTPDNMLATAVITTSFLPPLAKLGNVTVGTGGGVTTGMFQSLQDAITAVGAAGGGSILLKNGTYTTTSAITMPDVDLDIFGESQGGVIIQNLAGSNLFNYTNLTKRFSLNNLTIQSTNISTYSKMVYFTGHATNTGSLQIKNVLFILTALNSSEGDTGVHIDGGADGYASNIDVIRECIFNGGLYGVRSVAWANVKVKDCKFDSQLNSGIIVANNGGSTIISDNRLTNQSYRGIVDGSVTSENIISGNMIYLTTTAEFGIQFYGYGGNISNNWLFSSGTSTLVFIKMFISVGTWKKVNCISNRIETEVNTANSITGILCDQDGNDISNNNIYIANAGAGTNYGIRITRTTGDGSNNLISGNVIDLPYDAATNIQISLAALTTGNQGYNGPFITVVDNGTGNKVNKSS